MTQTHNFQVNLRGIIDLLSGHLYSGPQVYLRELLQNCVDAIAARKLIEPAHDGSVQFEVVEPTEKSPATLIVTDDGVGLTEPEVHEFLATIGQSSKRELISRDTFLGQFGIGLLSGFMVCEEIVVITRSAKETDAATVEWKGRSDGTYSIRVLDHDFEPGTQVFLRAKPGCAEFFEMSFVDQSARRFGQHLPIAIQVSRGNDRTLINTTPPWGQEFDNRSIEGDRLLDYGKSTFESPFLDAFPLRSDAGGIEGVAFVLPHAASLASRRRHRVYLKNMLLSEQVDNLLPDWAFFVQCVLNVNDLRPTASRESFHDDEQLAEARDCLGQALRDYLVDLSRTDRDRLNEIIALHYLPMKALAVEDDDFYRMFINWLPFETSLGQLTLQEITEHDDTVRFVSSRDQFRQVSGVASAQGLCIINAGYVYDIELFQKLPHLFPDRAIEPVDVSELAQSFEDLPLDEREKVFDFLRIADLALQPFRCQAEIRLFSPAELPALYTAGNDAAFYRSIEQTKESADEMWSDVLDGISDSSATSTWSQLCFNYRNPLVQRLAVTNNRRLVKNSIEMLYVQSLLLGHYPLKAPEMKLLNTGLLGLIEQGVEGSS